MDLLRILKQISTPLPYEEKKGYNNQSVKGGYTLFASEKVRKALEVETRDQVRLLLYNLLNTLEQYQQRADQHTFLKLSSDMHALRNFLLQPANLLESQSLLKKPLRYLKGVGPKKRRIV
jgi:hypothetical protein